MPRRADRTVGGRDGASTLVASAPDGLCCGARYSQARYHVLISTRGGAQRSSGRNTCTGKGQAQLMLAPLGSGWFPSASLLLAGVPAGPRIEPGEPGSLVGDVHNLGLADGGFPMTINGGPAGSPPEASLATPVSASAAPWRQVALFLTGAAQLISILARVSRDRSCVLVVPAGGVVAPWGEQAARGRRCEQVSCHPGSGKKAG
jgi:hypothetical protein